MGLRAWLKRELGRFADDWRNLEEATERSPLPTFDKHDLFYTLHWMAFWAAILFLGVFFGVALAQKAMIEMNCWIGPQAGMLDGCADRINEATTPLGEQFAWYTGAAAVVWLVLREVERRYRPPELHEVASLPEEGAYLYAEDPDHDALGALRITVNWPDGEVNLRPNPRSPPEIFNKDGGYEEQGIRQSFDRLDELLEERKERLEGRGED